MRRRRATSGKPAKAQQASKAKRGAASKVACKQPLSGKDSEIERLTWERDEALEREKATAEVLRIISNSPHDAQPIFDAITKRVPRLCKAPYCG